MSHDEDTYVKKLVFTIFLTRIITASICAFISLIAAILISISTFRSHCCNHQYSQKQRIFLYFLLVTLGYHISLVIQLPSLRYRQNAYGAHRPGLKCHMSAYLSQSFGWCQFFISSWAAVFLPCDVFTRLRGIQWQSRGKKCCMEICFLVVSAVFSFTLAVVPFTNNTYGYASGPWCWIISATETYIKNSSVLRTNVSNTGLKEQIWLWFVPGGVVSFISLVSILAVVIQLCIACRRIKARGVVNRLEGSIAESVLLAIFLIGHSLLWWVQLNERLVLQVDVNAVESDNALRLYIFFAISVPLSSSILPFGFTVYFGRKKIQQICGGCCCYFCSRCLRRYGYQSLEGTDRTYYTCDEPTTTEWHDALSHHPPSKTKQAMSRLKGISEVCSDSEV